jgi:hypothetical protein
MSDELGMVDSVEKVRIGDREWHYQAFYNGKGVCEAVRFYDGESGEFVTEFQDTKDMEIFLYHADAETVNEQLDMVKRFRDYAKNYLAETEGQSQTETAVSEKDKAENLEAFMRRIQMLKADMNNYEFSKILELNAGTVYNLVCGSRYVGTHALKRIADKCGVSTDWLIGRV